MCLSPDTFTDLNIKFSLNLLSRRVLPSVFLYFISAFERWKFSIYAELYSFLFLTILPFLRTVLQKNIIYYLYPVPASNPAFLHFCV